MLKAYVMENDPGTSGVREIDTDEKFECSVCKQSFAMYGRLSSVPNINGGSTPFIIAKYETFHSEDGPQKFCFDCSTKMWITYLTDSVPVGGKVTLYYVHRDDGSHEVTTWSGNLKIVPNRTSRGKHNIAGSVTTVHFRCGKARYIGRQYGENTQILYCRRLKT